MSGQFTTNPVCEDTRECFGAMVHGGMRFCRALSSTYAEDGQCPFCKPDRDITNGKQYLYNPDMEVTKKIKKKRKEVFEGVHEG